MGWLALLLVVMAACGGSQPQAETPSAERSIDLLRTLPAGAERVVYARPVVWSDSEAGRALLDVLVPVSEQEAFGARYGVPLGELRELVVADYQGDRLTLLRGLDAGAVVERASEGGDPAIDQVALDGETLLHRQAGPAAAVAFAMQRGSGDPALQVLADARPTGALAICVPHPLPLPPRSGIGLLLAKQTALVANLSPQFGSDELVLDLDLQGTFPASVEQNLRALVDSLAADPLGERLGLSAARQSLAVEVTDQKVHIRMRLPTAPLAATLSMLVSEDAWEPIRSHPPTPVAPSIPPENPGTFK